MRPGRRRRCATVSRAAAGRVQVRRQAVRPAPLASTAVDPDRCAALRRGSRFGRSGSSAPAGDASTGTKSGTSMRGSLMLRTTDQRRRQQADRDHPVQPEVVRGADHDQRGEHRVQDRQPAPPGAGGRDDPERDHDRPADVQRRHRRVLVGEGVLGRRPVHGGAVDGGGVDEAEGLTASAAAPPGSPGGPAGRTRSAAPASGAPRGSRPAGAGRARSGTPRWPGSAPPRSRCSPPSTTGRCAGSAPAPTARPAAAAAAPGPRPRTRCRTPSRHAWPRRSGRACSPNMAAMTSSSSRARGRRPGTAIRRQPYCRPRSSGGPVRRGVVEPVGRRASSAAVSPADPDHHGTTLGSVAPAPVRGNVAHATHLARAALPDLGPSRQGPPQGCAEIANLIRRQPVEEVLADGLDVARARRRRASAKPASVRTATVPRPSCGAGLAADPAAAPPAGRRRARAGSARSWPRTARSLIRSDRSGASDSTARTCSRRAGSRRRAAAPVERRVQQLGGGQEGAPGPLLVLVQPAGHGAPSYLT